MKWRMDLARLEARVLRAIGRGHTTAKAISEACDIPNAQIGRLCCRLQARNFVCRTDDQSIKRGQAVWALTARGQMVIRGMNTPDTTPRRAKLASAPLPRAFASDVLLAPEPILMGDGHGQGSAPQVEQQAAHD